MNGGSGVMATVSRRVKWIARFVKDYGIRQLLFRKGAAIALRRAVVAAPPAAASICVKPPQADHPIDVRLGASDIHVYHQIFMECEYAPLDHFDFQGLVIDAGANVGYSSVYFLSRHKRCHIVSVEPDADNFVALCKNIAPFGARATTVNAGLWSRPGWLSVREESTGKGAEWGRQFDLTDRPGEGACRAITVDSLLKDEPTGRIALLKVDIEGAEAEVFGSSSAAWLPYVDSIAIELHDGTPFGDARGAFHSAINGQDFDVITSGELLICTRRNRS